jgi:hypothetical protein
MIQRYFVADAVPEIRPEPGNVDKPNHNELLMHMPTEVFWELSEIIEKIHYCRISAESPTRYWNKLMRIVPLYLVEDKDRQWFAKHFAKRVK